MRKFLKKNLSLFNCDCLELLSSLDDNSIDLIATDPPYFKVKGERWDNQWKSKADFLAWLDSVMVELNRVLKPTGSLYLFAGPHLATEVEGVVASRFEMLNHIVWRKPSGRHLGCCKESLRRYFPQTEHVLFAGSVKPVPFAFGKILSHLEQSRLAAGVTRKAIDEACGCQMSGHWFGRSQFSFPSEKHYLTINELFGGTLKPYADLKAEFVAVRSSANRARRTFNVTKHVPYTNVWDFETVRWYEGKHPCEKPLDLMEHIIKASSLPGDLVLDAFAGSGSTAIACQSAGRRFVGCELGVEEFLGAVGRVGLG